MERVEDPKKKYSETLQASIDFFRYFFSQLTGMNTQSVYYAHTHAQKIQKREKISTMWFNYQSEQIWQETLSNLIHDHGGIRDFKGD